MSLLAVQSKGAMNGRKNPKTSGEGIFSGKQEKRVTSCDFMLLIMNGGESLFPFICTVINIFLMDFMILI